MKIREFFLTSLAILAVVAGEPHRFDNYQVFRLTVEVESQLKALKSVSTGPNSYEFLAEPTRIGRDVEILVPPSLQSDFDSLVAKNKISKKLLVSNFQDLVDKERPNKFASKAAEDFGWEDYHSVETIHEWLYSLEEQYEEVTVIKGGTTFEGREILGVNINRNPGQNPGIFIESNIHSNEWITHSSTTWIINKLLTATADEPGIKGLADNINWYIFPLVNADGYEYTRNVYRMWRKTRSPQGLICNGVDPNRNWDVYWEKGGIGSSDNMCDGTFAGPSAFSEIETRTLSEYILSIRDNLNFYIGFHSAANMLLFPWGHTPDPPSQYSQFMEIAEATVNALYARHGTVYTYGPVYFTIYPTTGISADWVHYTLGIPGFTYEFRNMNTETGEYYGQLAPPEQIQPNAEEVLDSLVVLVDKATELGYMDITMKRN
ncbi:zinc carboxypeptidase-like [Phlebotomus argentipes]|uniref:zinc carboxypeptidase-like n=1 Tax=Phlebotomus argentipes TaxID=94469 RepID=UPI0028936325|nr:zinc carboxypeptidase-like [Phlebotomus argentipes]